MNKIISNAVQTAVNPRFFILGVLAAYCQFHAQAAETNLIVETSSGRVTLVAPRRVGTNLIFEINPKAPAYSPSNPVRDINLVAPAHGPNLSLTARATRSADASWFMRESTPPMHSVMVSGPPRRSFWKSRTWRLQTRIQRGFILILWKDLLSNCAMQKERPPTICPIMVPEEEYRLRCGRPCLPVASCVCARTRRAESRRAATVNCAFISSTSKAISQM